MSLQKLPASGSGTYRYMQKTRRQGKSEVGGRESKLGGVRLGWAEELSGKLRFGLGDQDGCLGAGG